MLFVISPACGMIPWLRSWGVMGAFAGLASFRPLDVVKSSAATT